MEPDGNERGRAKDTMTPAPDNIDALIDRLAQGSLARELVSVLKDTERARWNEALRAKAEALVNLKSERLSDASDQLD